MYCATCDTPTFSFMAFAETKQGCKNLLCAAWKKHAHMTGADPDYMKDCDVSIVPVISGTVLRDREPFFRKEMK